MTGLFHPIIEAWFLARFGSPTAPQRRGWPAIRSGRHTLIAAPTGSGKTLAAFLSAIDDLFRRGIAGELADETTVVYVSPLKALSNDVQKNLAEPLAEISALAAETGLALPELRTAVRTGDTPAAHRSAMLRRPPHILVTTPESLFLLLTAARGREMLRRVRTIIVDEIHAVARDKRGSHLALSLERLSALAETNLSGRRPVRIGLSATQRPIEDVAQFLVGRDAPEAPCAIIDEGHARALDLAIEIPPSPLEAVMSNEVWEEVYERLSALIQAHRTTLVFVNTRRLSERLTARLSERLGEDLVTSHHGSLSREKRLEAEHRLKTGQLRALVATASLELGIDIGAVDLVCQLGSTRSIATLLQRVGRSGHYRGGQPIGRLFPLSRDDLVECAGLQLAVRRGDLDQLRIPRNALDVLAQQIVAAVAAEDWAEEALYELVRAAFPYRDLPRADFDAIVEMLSEGVSVRNQRKGRLIQLDGVNGRLHARRGARLAAITSGGAIPENADYRVLAAPADTFVGTVHEDFAVESSAGDIFQLGNTSWRIRRVEPGIVRVEDARGQPPTIPFWIGEAPSRSDEVSRGVSRVRAEVAARLNAGGEAQARDWLCSEVGLSEPAAQQAVAYLAATQEALGAIPTAEVLVLERFFDESGGMQLVLHAPLGGRINRAWGLALRKRFCRKFNFELQAAATEDAVVLSLGPQHSFPLEGVFHYLNTATLREVLVQALLAAPIFEARWRWNATRALVILRQRGGRRLPMPIQRMEAQDLLAAVFPDQAACAENLVGPPRVPDHPLVRETLSDCLHEALDLDGLARVLARIEAGQVKLVARDTPVPSPMAHEILTARPYAFLDDAPLEERRTQAVMMRRSLSITSASDIGALDAEAIARVRTEAWPDPTDPDELHDTLLIAGALSEAEVALGAAGQSFAPHAQVLAAGRRSALLSLRDDLRLWIAAERVPLWRAVAPEAQLTPEIDPPERFRKPWAREDAARELVRGRLGLTGPTTASRISESLGLPLDQVKTALLALEAEGFALRGYFEGRAEAGGELEWCDRHLLARIHRYTLDRLRQEIAPVSAADLMRFLLVWQRVEGDARVSGPQGLAQIVAMLDGYETAASAWERDILPSRVTDYEPRFLDQLCLAGEVGWARFASASNGAPNERRSGPLRATPVALFRREHEAAWRALGAFSEARTSHSANAQRLLELLGRRGACFFSQLVSGTALLPSEVENALGELVAAGLVSSDGFGGLRALLTPSNRRPPLGKTPSRYRRASSAPFGVQDAGRWSRLDSDGEGELGQSASLTAEQAAEQHARQLLQRYGVVFRRLIEREAIQLPWRELLLIYRRMEARGELRGGRFVSGFSGEQYALPEAVELLRSLRKCERRGGLVAISAADPLNLTGIVLPGARVPAFAAHRILLRDGIPIATTERGSTRFLAEVSAAEQRDAISALTRPKLAPSLRTYLGV